MLLDRSVISVKHKAQELGISLKITGEDIDLSEQPAKILQRIREVPMLNICPMCGIRFAIMRDTGMCRPCHLDQLIILRETQLEEAIRERELTKLRQDKKRGRLCNQCDKVYFPRSTTRRQICPECANK